MQDIKEAEADSVQDLGAFLEAELEYYDRCRDELLKLKREWPAARGTAAQQPRQSRRPEGRPRSNTAHSYIQIDSYGARSVSPATSHGSMGSRSASISAANSRRAPPPPPSRAKKPAPPPPMKRADISSVSVNSRY
ncbi:hypothetical protein DID88_009880 [Monilinia fructigena]|uniref:Uncharacterized protein n=1 Tax=Monilinia fructigena TaxID=38457 RepID=A0A395IKI8_9HELO|nr:hypothetical protein DID88_009880 [Monilinia fructigena]